MVDEKPQDVNKPAEPSKPAPPTPAPGGTNAPTDQGGGAGTSATTKSVLDDDKD